MSLSPLRVGIAAALLLFTAGSAQATKAEEALETAFATYCGTLKPAPTLCGKPGSPSVASSARQYLALEVVCLAGNTDPHCVQFATAKTKPGHETLEPLVLALDHKTGRWHFRNRLLGAKRAKWDVAGEPTISLAKQERVTVTVENTNPLLYGAAAGKPTEDNVPELAAIQKLLGAMGKSFASFLKVSAKPVKAGAAAGDPLKVYLGKVIGSVDAIKAEITVVDCRVGQTVAQTSDAIAFIQSVELGNGDEYRLEPPSPKQCPATNRLVASEVAKAFEQLRSTVFSPQDRPEDCTDLLDGALAVAVLDPPTLGKARTAFESLSRVGVGACTEFMSLKAEIDRLLLAVKDAVDAKDQAAMEVALRELIVEEVDQRLRQASSLSKKLKELRKEADGVLAQADVVHKAAAQVEVFERRLHQYRVLPLDRCGLSPSGVDCVKATSLDLRLFLEPQRKDVRQTKIQKHSVTVKPDSPYKSKVVATRPAEVKAGYQLDSILRGLWGISASVIYTDLDNPTFGAVTSADDPKKKVIAMTDETSRAGDLALFADFRLGQWLACRGEHSKCGSASRLFGVEVGAGLGDDAAFFAGISLRPHKNWRLGFGYTYQQVKELAAGVALGQEVASGDDIRTRDDFEGEWYLSLSFALDSLSLFSSGK